LLRHLRQPFGRLKCLCADDDARDAKRESVLDIVLCPQSAAELARNVDGFGDCANGTNVDRASFFCAIEIDKMQVRRPVGDPALRHRGGIGTEDRFLCVIALLEANDLAVDQIASSQLGGG
jgi:hypothetical protein